MRVTTLARRLGSVALVLTTGAGLAACSDGSGSGPDGSSSSATDGGAEGSEEPADDSAEDSGGTTGASVAELSAADFYPSVMAALRDAETFAFETTTSGMGGQTQTMSGTARFSDEGVEMQATGTGAQAMDMILLGQTMYMRSPDLGTGDKWLKIDLSDPDSLFGMIGRLIDPEVMFKAMETPKRLELVGAEEVDGVETNHYRITLDPTRYLEAMRFPAAMADMVPDELVTEMWVDADNLPRKFAQTTEIPAMGGGQPTTSTTEGTYSDFGTDVDIQAPPAGEVTEQPGL